MKKFPFSLFSNEIFVEFENETWKVLVVLYPFSDYNLKVSRNWSLISIVSRRGQCWKQKYVLLNLIYLSELLKGEKFILILPWWREAQNFSKYNSVFTFECLEKWEKWFLVKMLELNPDFFHAGLTFWRKNNVFTIESLLEVVKS